MSEEVLPFKYFGTLTGMKWLPVRCFDAMLERVQNEKHRYCLSRVTLIQSVLQSIPLYVLYSSWVPQSVLDKLE